ncbi:MAG: hypothetical protein J0M04_03035 [Verrucomicrobia bacterium]|nr:hypothetical protein [Verrucomicrobiota bacterium]
MPHHPSDPGETIEAEVLEIDGQTPPPPAPDHHSGSSLRPADFNPFHDPDDRTHDPSGRPAWQSWQGNIRGISPIWWPLLLIAGAVLLFLLLTIGLVVGALFLIIRTIARLIRALVS